MEKIRKIFGNIPAYAGEYAKKTYKIGVFGVKNNFVLVGILLIGFCLIAPAIYVTGTSGYSPDYDQLWSVMGIYSIIAAYVGGLLIPAVMFSYVHKRRDRDFYHSMPVKRGQYFIGYFLSGFVMFTVPYLMMCVIMGLVGGHVGGTFSFVFQTLALYIIVYATTLFAIMFSGSILSSLVTLAFLNAFPVIVIFCLLDMSGNIDLGAYMTLLSPYIYIFTPLSGGFAFNDYFNQGEYGWTLGVQLAIAVIELVLAFIMYNLRRGETTMAVAFPKTRYILQYGTMFLVALACTNVFSGMWWWWGGSRGSIATEAVVWTAIAVFVTFVLMNMILEQSFRAAFHRIRHLFIFAGVFVVLLSLMLGFVNSLPYYVTPIKTDAILVQQHKYVRTYDKPDGNADYYTQFIEYDEYGNMISGGYAGEDYIESNYPGNENIKILYHIDMGEEWYIVTDPAQVAVLTQRISDEQNGKWSPEIVGSERIGELCSLSWTLYTLKPGEKIDEKTYIDDLRSMSSQRYSLYLGEILGSDSDYFTDGIDMTPIQYRPSYDFIELI